MPGLPLISIIVPVYQAESFIENTINNLEQQTYKNIEIICVDDKSTDSSYEICKILKVKYDNLKLYRNERNSGQEYTRNAGIDKASGAYFTFVDADDTVDPEMIRELYLSASLSDADITISGYKTEYNSNSEKHLAAIAAGTYSPEIFASFLYAECPLDVFCCIGGKLYKTDFIHNCGIRFDIRYKYNEDLAFVTSALKHARKISYVNECYYNYLIRFSGSTMSSRRNNMFESMIRVQELYKSLLEQYGVYEQKKSIYLYKVYIVCVSSLLNEANYGTYSSFKDLLCRIRDYSEYPEIFHAIRMQKTIAKKHKLINECIFLKFDLLLYILFSAKKSNGRY